MTQPIGQFVTPKEVEEFRRIVKEARGVELTFEEALDIAERLVRVLKIVRDVAGKTPAPETRPDRT